MAAASTTAVRERADAVGDAEARATLEAVQAQHRIIDPLAEACSAGFRSMASTPAAETRDRLAALSTVG